MSDSHRYSEFLSEHGGSGLVKKVNLFNEVLVDLHVGHGSGRWVGEKG